MRRLDLAEQFVHDAIRDGDVEFLNDTILHGTPTAIGTYALRLRCDDGSETCSGHSAAA